MANVGDSRAILSADHGQDWYSLSRDHRPSEPYEISRIKENGGHVYQHSPEIDVMRVFPGRLSVSRTFGDIHAKIPARGGKEGVVIAKPEVSQFTIKDDYHDFIVMGCDGIFDKLDSPAVMNVAWDTIKRGKAST